MMSNPPRRLLFVEQFYYPEGWGGAELPRDLTIHLSKCGYCVEVICGSDQYAAVEGDPGPDPAGLGVRIRRVPGLFGGGIHSKKLLKQIWFYACLLPLLLFRRPPAAFIAQTNPPLAITFIACVASLWRRPLLIIAMDIYPEVIVAHGALRPSSFLAKTLSILFRWTYRRARIVVSLGPVMTERLIAKGVERTRILEIPNWSTGIPGVVRGESNSLTQSWGLRDKFVLLYSGNLGIAHEFDTLLKAIQRASRLVPSLRLVIVGKGKRLASVIEGVESLGLGDFVQFHDLLPAQRMPEGMGVADMALVTLQPGFEGLVVPSKLQGYMARGLPVVYVGPRSDVSEFVAHAGCGVAVANGEAEALSDAIVRLQNHRSDLAEYGRLAQSYYESSFAKQHGLAAYESAVQLLLTGYPAR